MAKQWSYIEAFNRVLQQEQEVERLRQKLREAEYELNLRYSERSRANAERLNGGR